MRVGSAPPTRCSTALIILARVFATGNMRLRDRSDHRSLRSATLKSSRTTEPTLARTAEVPRGPVHFRRNPTFGRTAHVDGRAHVPPIAELSTVIAPFAFPREPPGSETLADAGLQLRIAPRRIQEFGGHTAAVVLRSARVGARIGLRCPRRHSEDGEEGSERHSPYSRRRKCSQRHVPPPHTGLWCWAAEPEQTREASAKSLNVG